jgi:replication initiation protein RepC
MTLAMLAGQMAEPPAGRVADKWKLYRALCDARPRLGLTDRALALLNALLTFHPGPDLSADQGLVVFPSNSQLSARAHGMAEQTIRRHLAALVDAGIIARKDSANGKRYARRGGEGVIDEAFGFSLAPLLAKAEEIEAIAADVVAERLLLQRLKERFTICRRDVVKLIAAAIDEGTGGDWETHQLQYRAIVAQLGRKPSAGELAARLEEMELLRDGIVNQLEMLVKRQNTSGNDPQNERHKQNSNTESSSELEPRLENAKGAPAEPEQYLTGRTDRPDIRMEQGRGTETGRPALAERRGRPVPPASTGSAPDHHRLAHAAGDGGAGATAGIRPFPLGMVLRACPQIADYGPGGQIGSWRELMAAAVVVRAMLGVSPSAYEEACAVMGPENAAATVACILERAGHINSAGGYLRDLTRRAERGEFSLGPILMAQLRANDHRKVG